MDKQECKCEEMSCKEGCSNNHTHKTFWCEKCHPERYEDKQEEWGVDSEGAIYVHTERGNMSPQEYIKDLRDTLIEKIKPLFIDFSAKTKEERENMDEGDVGYMHGSNDLLEKVEQIILEIMK